MSRRLELVRLALEGFGVEAVRIRLAYNSTNLKYRVTTTEGFALAVRVGRDRQPWPVWARSIAAWQASLAGDGFDVPKPLRALDGDWIVTIRDSEQHERACAASTWLPGRRLLPVPTDAYARGLGILLAKLHQYSLGFDAPEGFELRQPFVETDGVSGGAITLVNRTLAAEQRAVVDRWRHRVADAVAAARACKQYGVVVGDFGPHNVVWVRGEPRLVDFGDTAWCAFGYDVAYLCECLGPRRSAALDGYASVRGVPGDWQLMRGAFHLKVMHARVGRSDGAEIVGALAAELAALEAAF